MRLTSLSLNGFKSFAKRDTLTFDSPIVCVVGPNGSGKSNVVEAIRFALGEQSMKSMRGKAGTDLIFKGSKHLQKGARASVSMYFDNNDKVFKIPNEEGENIKLNYSTVSIGRDVYPDGVNKYILNDEEVRLKDINNLLSSVNIGSSGHHIISQGEADRILNANVRERREMIEDALGLKVYQYKIKETERKLERATLNMQEVSIQRRENAPHLRFLAKQVEKIEKAKELSNELLHLYHEYLKRESVYIKSEESRLKTERIKISQELRILEDQISETKEDDTSQEKNMNELSFLERNLMEIRNVKGDLERKLGRIEGMMEAEEERIKRINESEVIDGEKAKVVFEEIDLLVEKAIAEGELSGIKSILYKIKEAIKNIYHSNKETGDSSSFQLNTFQKNKEQVLSEIEKITNEEKELTKKIEDKREETREFMESLRQKEKEKFGLKVRQQELSSHLEMLNIKENNLRKQKEQFDEEVSEGKPLVGQDIMLYQDFAVNDIENRNLQEELRKRIERIKIRLEDAGLAGGGDILKEYKEATDRDVFLSSQLEDLEKSIESLNKIINDLKDKIDIEFKDGIKKINKEFQNLFSKMFGGGNANLEIVVQNKGRSIKDEEEENFEEEIVFEQGIEINVSLPHKKVKELQALSGGERSLTSIALLFAMSQVNPPPFLVLDETDAALDEANSRKYGDMLEMLSKHSQLIVITHNRETMSRAGVLYGVTIGADGASKLLSVKFDEAVAIAK
ncbi:MAG: AAA family ATPase [Candidatus Paceibacterota bacterium]|jgi:chromosome segregation protein